MPAVTGRTPTTTTATRECTLCQTEAPRLTVNEDCGQRRLAVAATEVISARFVLVDADRSAGDRDELRLVEQT